MKGSVEGMAYPHTQTSRLAWLTQKTAGNWRRDDWQKAGLTKGFCSQPGASVPSQGAGLSPLWNGAIGFWNKRGLIEI